MTSFQACLDKPVTAYGLCAFVPGDAAKGIA